MIVDIHFCPLLYLYDKYNKGVGMISVRLPKEMEERIERLAKSTRRPKSFFIKEALANYLDDMEDYYEVLKRRSDPNRELITIEELEAALGLQDPHR
jgi:RHH-type rel operon transcriptional repressor/antitoxin RelB